MVKSDLCLYLKLIAPIRSANMMLSAELVDRICPYIPTGVLKVSPMSINSNPVTRFGSAVISLDITSDGISSLDVSLCSAINTLRVM